jgi:hypothetical protein
MPRSDGDGAAEIIYRDELNVRVYRGTDGKVLWRVPMSSCTWHEYPVVADVDADGHADLVVPANNNCAKGPEQGITVFRAAQRDWMQTRAIWNQYTYHITNVGDDGSIPAVESANWLTYNNYRQNLVTGDNADGAAWSSYGQGKGSTHGAPAPRLLSATELWVGNVLGRPTQAYLLIGDARAKIPTAFAGDLLVAGVTVLPFTLEQGGTALALPEMAETDVIALQVIAADSGAPLGWSFSSGLEVRRQ